MIAIETLNGWAESWASFMWDRTIDSAIVLLIVGGIWLLLSRRLSPQFGYWLFMLVLVELFFPSFVSIPGDVEAVFPQKIIHEQVREIGPGERWFFRQPGGISMDSSSRGMAPILHEGADQGAEFTLLSILMLAWGLVVFLQLLRFVFYQWSTRRRLRNAEPLDLNLLPVNLEQLREIAGVKRPVRWLTCSWANSPVVWGVFRPTIVVPADLFGSFSKNQAKWILLHELAHVRRGDNVVSMIQAMLQVIFFFNPAVWIANMLIDRQREYACDDVALAGCGAPRSECGEGFLSIVRRADSLPTFITAPLGLLNRNTLIRRRMMRILDTKRKLHLGLSVGSLIFLFAVTLIVLPSVRAQQRHTGGGIAVAERAALDQKSEQQAREISNEKQPEFLELEVTKTVYTMPGSLISKRAVQQSREMLDKFPQHEGIAAEVKSLERILEKGYQYSYPTTFVVEIRPDGWIPRYRVDYDQPVIMVTDPSFTPEKPIIECDEHVTIIEHRDDKRYEATVRIKDGSRHEKFEDMNDPVVRMQCPLPCGWLYSYLRLRELIAEFEQPTEVTDKGKVYRRDSIKIFVSSDERMMWAEGEAPELSDHWAARQVHFTNTPQNNSFPTFSQHLSRNCIETANIATKRTLSREEAEKLLCFPSIPSQK